MPVQPPWTLDVETIVGVAITLLAVLAVQVAIWLRDRRRERSNRYHWGALLLRLVDDPYWKDRSGGAVGTHDQGGAGKYRRGAVDQERLQAMTDDFRAPLEQDPARRARRRVAWSGPCTR